jgi:hypothetical protein
METFQKGKVLPAVRFLPGRYGVESNKNYRGVESGSPPSTGSVAPVVGV